jgi:membrane protein
MTTRQTARPAPGPQAGTPVGPALAGDAERPVSFGIDLWRRYQAHDLSGLAAELAYRYLFALFPFVLFLTALAAFVAVALGLGDPTPRIVGGLGDNLPPALAGTVQQELQNVIGQQRLSLVSTGAVLALWAATSGTMTLIKAMNRAYGVRETRSLIRRYALGLVLTIAGALAVLVAFVTIVGGALLTEQAVAALGLGNQAWSTVSLLRWPLVGAILIVAAAVIYRYGPNLQPSWGTALTGAVVFAVGWLVATFLFAQYVTRVANYGATYGALGGIIVLMIWLYLTGLVQLVGAEIVAIRLGKSDPERIAQRQAETGAVDVVAKTRVVAVEALADLRRSADAQPGTAEDAQARTVERSRADRTAERAGRADASPPQLGEGATATVSETPGRRV